MSDPGVLLWWFVVAYYLLPFLQSQGVIGDAWSFRTQLTLFLLGAWIPFFVTKLL